MTFPELDKKFDTIINDAKTHYHGDLMANVGMHARKLIFDRVTKTGVMANGSKFPAYSTKPMLSGCSGFVNKSSCSVLLNSKEKRKGYEWRTVKGNHLFILPGGYKQFRSLQGRQTAFVDFTMTGRMWNDINLISSSSDHQKGTAIIGARLPEEKKKLEGNTKRKGEILDLRMQEVETLMKEYSLGFLQVVRNNGL